MDFPLAMTGVALGMAVGNNRHLLELSVDKRSIQTESLLEFLPGLSLNRSIKELTITGWDLSVVEVRSNLIRFFNDNQAFESLTIIVPRRGEGDSLESMSSMVLALRRFYSLKEFRFRFEGHFDQGVVPCADNAIDALVGHAGLRKISLSFVRIDTRGCASLASLLENRQSNLTSLTLSRAKIDDERARILASGIASNTTLTKLILDTEGITLIGKEAFFRALLRSRCRLELLHAWVRHCCPSNLVLLRVLLQHKSTLKRLELNSLPGLECVSQLLRGTDSVLESLSLSQIDDDEITALSEALENNSNTKLKEFNLQSDMITFEAWIAWSTVLSFRTSMLEKMYLASYSYHSINDDVLISFAEALVNNKVLRELELGNDFSGITSIGYAAFTRLLCNSSSIMSTYQSNHTLKKICDRYSLNNNVPEDLRFLLQLNEKNTVSQAARLKIIKTHFSGSEINMQSFMNMDVCVRPHAIAWMVRDKNAFHLLRALPMLLENNVLSQVNLK